MHKIRILSIDDPNCPDYEMRPAHCMLCYMMLRLYVRLLTTDVYLFLPALCPSRHCHLWKNGIPRLL